MDWAVRKITSQVISFVDEAYSWPQATLLDALCSRPGGGPSFLYLCDVFIRGPLCGNGVALTESLRRAAYLPEGFSLYTTLGPKVAAPQTRQKGPILCLIRNCLLPDAGRSTATLRVINQRLCGPGFLRFDPLNLSLPVFLYLSYCFYTFFIYSGWIVGISHIFRGFSSLFQVIYDFKRSDRKKYILSCFNKNWIKSITRQLSM